MKRREWVSYGETMLKDAKIENATGEAWYLFSHCFSISREDYIFSMMEEVDDQEAEDEYKRCLQERITKHVPLQYLIGTQDFMGYTFKVTPDVLIPRQDTETVLEEIMATGVKPCSILDLCTGSGCIGISLSLLLKPDVCVATDIDENALKVAKENGRNLSPMVKFIQSDLFSNVKGSFDLIVSNPPYISTKDCRELMPEVREHEPMLALDGKEDGLYFYRRIIKEAANYLNDHGMLAFEIGYDQGEAVSGMMREAGYVDVQVKKDLANLDRLVMGKIDKGERYV